jgi:aryl-alcohol dehydrogenase-like predicted oxidoreductase
LTVIVKEALANGRLASRGDVPLLLEIARGVGATPDALALAAALAQPWADVVLSGASTVPMLESNLRATDLEVGPELIEQFEAVREEPTVYWDARAGLAWN